MSFRIVALSAVVLLAIAAGRTDAQVVRQATSDAWWTGPLLANSAATLPRGHFLVESYLYDVISTDYFDPDRARQGVPRSDSYGSQSYLLYGLVDRLSVGLVPNFGFTTGDNVLSSTHVGAGDLGIMTQLRLTQVDPHDRMPTISINLQETLPTGKYDRLGRAFDGLGSGVYTTTLSLYSQKYFWLPTGRILRMRLNVSQAFSGRASVEDASVYGTDAGFRGEARPGKSTYVNGAWEYSVTRRWVAALDATYRRVGGTELTTFNSTPRAFTKSQPSDAVGLAPAVEYNWSGNVGVIIGTRLIVAGRNTPASITPAVAINIVH